MQLGHDQDERCQYILGDRLLRGQVIRPGHRNIDACRRGHHEHVALEGVGQLNGFVVHHGQLGLSRHWCGDDHGLNRIALLLGFLKRHLPVAIGSDWRGQAGPAVTTVEACSGDLGFQIAGRNAQLNIQITVSVQRDQRTDVFRRDADE
jgi:hypothetical protein